MNRILDSKPTITGPHFVYHMPKWGVIALKGVFLLFGVASFCLAFYWQGINPIFISGFIYFLSGALLLIAVVFRGREVVYFICDYSGMYFPPYKSLLSLRPVGEYEAWLFVPWTNIKEIRIERLPSFGTRYTRGVAFCLRATAEEAEMFLSTFRMLSWANTGAEKNWLAGYVNGFQRPKKVVSILEQFSRGFRGEHA
jgi:hypothetical protein